jgi:molybdopterin-binding protein
MVLKVKDLMTRKGSFILQNITFEVPDNSYMVILGPTGSGKTTLLETIAGLNQIIKGKIFINNNDITDLPPEKRNISVVFQNLALFPHMTVYENIEYGLLARGLPKQVRAVKVNEIMKIFELESLRNRRVINLSGGEKQRVALARALIIKPHVILLDEPFSSLDVGTRKQFWKEVKKILKEYKVPVLHVTHDQEEAMYLGEIIAIMKDGKIIEQGSVEQIFSRPKNAFVADFLQYQNIFTGVAESNPDGTSKVSVNGTKFIVNGKHEGRIIIGIRPENILISKTPPEFSTARNILRGSIVSIEPAGPAILLTVNVNSLLIKVMITRGSLEELELKHNDIVYLIIKASSITILSE